MRRALHFEPGDPPFGTYDTVKHEKDNFQCTLRLSEKARDAVRLTKMEYKGEVGGTKLEAETLAARVFWDDPLVKEKAAKLPPGINIQKRKKTCAEYLKGAMPNANAIGDSNDSHVHRKGSKQGSVPQGTIFALIVQWGLPLEHMNLKRTSIRHFPASMSGKNQM